jgi:parallel beta-helix repeat protein
MTAAAGAVMLIAGAVTASAAEGSQAWGASLPEYALVTSLDLVADGNADNTGDKSSSSAFQKCLDKAKNMVAPMECLEIYVPAGTYKITKSLRVYSNTRIICEDGVLIQRCYDGGAILSTNPGAGGFDSAENILIQGGTWDGNTANYGGVNTFSNIRIGHASNIVLRGMNIINNKAGHHIEIGGARGITIDGCQFSGYYGDVMKEAIQLDVMNKEELFAGYAPFDDTACDNIIIRGCTFLGIPRAIGSHSAVAGIYYTNVTITDNTFENISNYALFLYNYKHCTIRNNTFVSCGAGILFNYMTDESFRHFFPAVNGTGWSAERIDGNADAVIEGNQIDTTVTDLQPFPFGIKLYGASVGGTYNYPAANYYISNVDVRDNNINSAYSGIIMSNVYDSSISGNSVNGKADGAGGHLINADYCYNCGFNANTLTGSLKSGMHAENSSGLNVEGNICANCASVGILMNNVSGSDVTKNSFQDNTLGGIKLADGCSEFTCSNNVIRGGGYAIKVTGSGSGTDIKLKSNDISACETGISCAENGKAYMVGNTFEAVAKKVTADSDGLVTLSKPRDFAASDIGCDRVRLTWKSSDEAAGINLYRRTGGGEYILIASGDSGTIFEDTSLEQGTNYSYKLVPFIYVGEEKVDNTPSDEAAARTKISMDSAEIRCVSVAGFTGRAVTPDFSVKYNGRELIPGVDYEYAYNSNLYMGRAVLTLTGKGDYLGTQDHYYEIKLGAAPIVDAAAKTPGLAGMAERKHCSVNVKVRSREVLAVSDVPVDMFTRSIEAITMQSPYKVTSTALPFYTQSL